MDNVQPMIIMRGSLRLVILLCMLTGCGKVGDGVDPHEQIKIANLVASSPYRFQIVRLFDLGRRDVRNFAFSPVTRQLFVSHLDKKDNLFYQWDIDSGKLVHTYCLGGNFMCDNITVSPDGRYLLVGCWPFDGSNCKTLLIDTNEKLLVHRFEFTDRIFESRFSADNRLVWMRTSGASEKGLAFRIDGTKLVEFASEDFPRSGPPNVWRVPAAKGEKVRSGLYYRNPQGSAYLLTDRPWHDNFGLTSDGNLIAATDWDDHVSVWDTQSRELLLRAQTTQHDNGGGYLAYDPKYNRFLIGDCSYNGTSWLRALTITRNAPQERSKQGESTIPSKAAPSVPSIGR